MINECFLCGQVCITERHHIFGGALRQKSDRLGLCVDLCPECHNRPPKGAHFNAETMQYIHEYGQRKAMAEQGWSVEEFRKEFYKNYI